MTAPEALCFRRFRFLFLPIMETGGGIGGAVLETGIDAVSAGDRIVSSFPEFDVVLPEMQAVFAGWFLHVITSICVVTAYYSGLIEEMV